MNISRSILKWMLLGLGLWALAPLAKGQQDTLHLFMSDTTIYRGTDWNKKFSITISAQAPYPSTVQFSFVWGTAWPLSNVYDFKLEEIVPVDTPNVSLSHFGRNSIDGDALRVITRITPRDDGKPKALFRLFFTAENPEALDKELSFSSHPPIDLPIQLTFFSDSPIEIAAIGDDSQKPFISVHNKSSRLGRAIWPGDVDNNGIVDQYDMLTLGLEIPQNGIRPRKNASLEWAPQEVGTLFYPFINSKEFWNTDGNGEINLNDTLAIHLNWGKTVPNRKIQPRTARDTFSFPLSLHVDTLRNRREIEIPITLGSADIPIPNAYGLTFSINYGSGIGKAARISIDFSKSFFKQENRPIPNRPIFSREILAYMRKDTLENKLHVVVSRLKKYPITGYGEIARIKLTVEDLIFIEPFLKNLHIDPRSIMMIDQDNKPIPVAPVSGEIRLISDIEQIFQDPLDHKLTIYPTPCDDILHLQYGDLIIQNISIFSQDGKLVQQFPQFNQREIDTSPLPNGTYQLYIESTEGKGVKKFLVQH